ncbi:hypothetical protein DHEL01_v210868 [Diaporthe helianthi]|uniref:Uncharacterized protein n=1 Tax=Diaporthe helianthi TaxID=158607 RepID=A0A2P5HKF3_DIAHE|nr:hypothetical protein DHEL01_v210868 [Diaporthe helianthi]
MSRSSRPTRSRSTTCLAMSSQPLSPLRAKPTRLTSLREPSTPTPQLPSARPARLSRWRAPSVPTKI